VATSAIWTKISAFERSTRADGAGRRIGGKRVIWKEDLLAAAAANNAARRRNAGVTPLLQRRMERHEHARGAFPAVANLLGFAIAATARLAAGVLPAAGVLRMPLFRACRSRLRLAGVWRVGEPDDPAAPPSRDGLFYWRTCGCMSVSSVPYAMGSHSLFTCCAYWFWIYFMLTKTQADAFKERSVPGQTSAQERRAYCRKTPRKLSRLDEQHAGHHLGGLWSRRARRRWAPHSTVAALLFGDTGAQAPCSAYVRLLMPLLDRKNLSTPSQAATEERENPRSLCRLPGRRRDSLLLGGHLGDLNEGGRHAV